MIPLRRRINKNSIFAAPIYSTIVRRFSTASPQTSLKATLSAAKYDGLIDAAARKSDFAAVRSLLTERIRDGRFCTTNTFKFIATNISALDDLLQNLVALDDWFTRKNAHDALVSQLAKLHRTDDALRVPEAMARKNYGATAITFCPIINALAKKKGTAAAWRVVDSMRACNIQPNLMAFNYILTAYCIDGDVVSAAQVLEKMEEEGMKADAVTYDALVLGACRARKVEESLAVMRRAVEEKVPALFSTYTHIIKEMLDCGFYKQAAEFVRIFAGKNEKLDVEIFGFLARRLKYMKKNSEAKLVVEEMVRRDLAIADDLGPILHVEEMN